jgi:hypothetical protein
VAVSPFRHSSRSLPLNDSQVFPKTARLDEQRPGTHRFQPVPDFLRCHLRAVVGPNMFRIAVLRHSFTELFDHMGAVEAPRHADRQTFARELIDQGQQPQTASTHACGLRRNRSYTRDSGAPAAAGCRTRHSAKGAGVASAGPELSNLRVSRSAPHDLADRPARLLQHRRKSPVTKAAGLHHGACVG